MIQTGDLALIKQLNKAIILDTIRHSSPISRTAIAVVSGLTKSTVSVLTSELVADQLVLEIGAGRSSGGRKPQLLSFNSRAGYALGLELGVNFIRGALCDLSGHAIRLEQDTLAPDAGLEQIADALIATARRLIGKVPESPLGILGLGIGVPGTVNTGQGTILLAPNLGWRDVPLRLLLEGALGIPVFVENEANAAALGEKQRGAGTRARNIIYVSVGMGLGAGVILNGKIYRGSHGVAGEVGHMTVESGGPVCSCGNRGCWELFTSERALRKILPPGLTTMDLGQLCTMAEAGDGRVIAALHTIGEHLGSGLVSVVHAYDPELVIVGGPLARAGKWLLNPAEQVLRARVMHGPGRDTPLVAGILGLNACALGGASIILERQFDRPSVNAVSFTQS